MTNEYEISEENTDQLRQIVDTNYQIFRGMYEQEPYSLERYTDRLKNQTAKILVAKIDNNIVGDSISIIQGGNLYIWVVGVLKEHRNKGIATEFFVRNEQYAKNNNLNSITLKVYNVSVEMLRMVLAMGYQILNVEQSITDPRYNAIHLEKKIRHDS